MGATLNPRQEARLRELMKDEGATGYIASRDEPHDEHVFVEMFAGGVSVGGEVIIEGDGTVEG